MNRKSRLSWLNDGSKSTSSINSLDFFHLWWILSQISSIFSWSWMLFRGFSMVKSCFPSIICHVFFLLMLNVGNFREWSTIANYQFHHPSNPQQPIQQRIQQPIQQPYVKRTSLGKLHLPWGGLRYLSLSPWSLGRGPESQQSPRFKRILMGIDGILVGFHEILMGFDGNENSGNGW